MIAMRTQSPRQRLPVGLSGERDELEQWSSIMEEAMSLES
jgi:hypothetical protein